MEDILIPFLAISAAELFDKSQLSLLLLSTRTKQLTPLLLGSLLGFAIIDGAAVITGAWITTILPLGLLGQLAGALFILIGLLTLRQTKHAKEDAKKLSGSPFVAGFLIIMLTEWGDKTQLATAVFATQFNPLSVFIGVMAALLLLSAAAVYLGKLLRNRINPTLIHRIAGVAFVIIGILFLLFPHS